MSDLYVEDILGARPGLKERAAEAQRQHIEAEEARRRDEEADIIREVCAWLLKELQCAPQEIEDLNFIRGPKSSDGSTRQVHFDLDGVRFRAYFTNEKVTTIASDGGTERRAIYDQVLEVQASKNGSIWAMVRNLADVGMVIQ